MTRQEVITSTRNARDLFACEWLRSPISIDGPFKKHRSLNPGAPVAELPAVLHVLSHRDSICDRVCDTRGAGG